MEFSDIPEMLIPFAAAAIIISVILFSMMMGSLAAKVLQF